MAFKLPQKPFFNAFGEEAEVAGEILTVVMLDEESLESEGDGFGHTSYSDAIHIQEADIAKFIVGETITVDGRTLQIFDKPRKQSDGFWRVNLEP